LIFFLSLLSLCFSFCLAAFSSIWKMIIKSCFKMCGLLEKKIRLYIDTGCAIEIVFLWAVHSFGCKKFSFYVQKTKWWAFSKQTMKSFQVSLFLTKKQPW
jgi:hypothetical protein